MPFTHVEIEERKTKKILVLFAGLLAVYLVSLYALAVLWHWTKATGTLSWFVRKESLWPSWHDCLGLLFLSLVFSAIHWEFSVRGLFQRTLEALNAKPLDSGDAYHVRLGNTVDEVCLATGGKRIAAYVIPTPALNACAVSDFEGNAAILVTEGALAWLSREQLEAVVGHEAGHIVSGDSLTDTVFCALFAMHEEVLEALSTPTEALYERKTQPFILVVYLVLWATRFLRLGCSFAVSRQKEYRADAVAVRLTRDPLALAEALTVISKRWRGVGMQGALLSSLFIVDPGVEYLSESEGWLADWFSTHPPLQRRIETLAGMAGMGAERFEQAALKPSRQPAAPVVDSDAQPPPSEPAARWMVWDAGTWRGPLSWDAMADVALKPETWVRRENESFAHPAHQDPLLLAMLRQRYAQAAQTPAVLECPHCRIGLIAKRYEGARIDECPACRGCYVDSDSMVKIFTRQVAEIPEPVKRMGDILLSEQGYRTARQRLEAHRDPKAKRWPCPRCQAAVIHKFYTDAYPIEVDQCWECGFVWLDASGLELLQHLYEKRRQWHDEDNHAPSMDVPPAA